MRGTDLTLEHAMKLGTKRDSNSTWRSVTFSDGPAILSVSDDGPPQRFSWSLPARFIPLSMHISTSAALRLTTVGAMSGTYLNGCLFSFTKGKHDNKCQVSFKCVRIQHFLLYFMISLFHYFIISLFCFRFRFCRGLGRGCCRCCSS